jgi:hypothetical protein
MRQSVEVTDRRHADQLREALGEGRARQRNLRRRAPRWSTGAPRARASAPARGRPPGRAGRRASPCCRGGSVRRSCAPPRRTAVPTAWPARSPSRRGRWPLPARHSGTRRRRTRRRACRSGRARTSGAARRAADAGARRRRRSRTPAAWPRRRRRTPCASARPRLAAPAVRGPPAATRLAGEQVRVVARQQHHLAGARTSTGAAPSACTSILPSMT